MQTAIDIEHLIRKIQRDRCDDAYQRLLREFEPLITRELSRGSYKIEDKEEMRSAAQIGLWKAASVFQIGRGCPRGFIAQKISFAIKDEARKLIRRSKSDSMRSEGADVERLEDDSSDRIRMRIDVQEQCRSVAAELDPLPKVVMDLLSKDRSQAAIGRILGISTQQVNEVVRQSRLRMSEVSA